MVNVKVCGITNIEDALKAVEYGADTLGFNFYPPSPRYLSPDQARTIVLKLPPGVGKVAVFVNESREKVTDVLNQLQLISGHEALNGVQFHGDEDGEYCRGWSLKVIKAIRVRGPESLLGLKEFPADLFLLDSWSEGYGGSGSQFRWSWIEDLDPSRLILSGGLDLDNIRQAVTQIRPFGVDVCSGVEAKPGIKDHGKLKEFIAAAKAS
jgi:phosphoribosylanthranilate isomerase